MVGAAPFVSTQGMHRRGREQPWPPALPRIGSWGRLGQIWSRSCQLIRVPGGTGVQAFPPISLQCCWRTSLGTPDLLGALLQDYQNKRVMEGDKWSQELVVCCMAACSPWPQPPPPPPQKGRSCCWGWRMEAAYSVADLCSAAQQHRFTGVNDVSLSAPVKGRKPVIFRKGGFTSV